MIYRTLSDEEKTFYLFIETLIACKKGEYCRAHPKINELLNAKVTDDVLKMAIIDLALDYYFNTNKIGPFYNLFSEFRNLPLSIKYQQINIKHQLQALVNRYEDQDVELCFNIHLGSAGENLADYHYYFAYYLLKKKEYQKVYNHLIESKLTSKTLLLLAIAIDKLHNDSYKFDFLNHHLIKDKRYDERLKLQIEYYIMKLEKYDQGYLLNYLRRITNNRDFIFASGNLINDMLKEEYITLAYELGRYKEVVKTFLTFI